MIHICEMGKLFKVIFAIVGLLGIGIVVLSMLGMREIDRQAALSPEERKAEQEKYAAERAAEAKKRLVENADGHLCLNMSGENDSVIDQMKPNLREPDSFEHIRTEIGPVMSNGKHALVMRYRARNGFGGMSIGTVEALVSNLDCSAAIVSTKSS